MANPDTRKLLKLINTRVSQTLHAHYTICHQSDTLCGELNLLISNDTLIRNELDTVRNKLVNLLNSNSFKYEKTDTCPFPSENLINDGMYFVNGLGLAASAIEYKYYVRKSTFGKQKYWRGKNGVWHAVDINDQLRRNDLTLEQNTRINNKWGKISEKCLWISILWSGYQIYDGIKSNNDYKVIKAGLDIAVGFIAAYGGPGGWVIGAIYLMLDIGGAFDPPRPNIDHSPLPPSNIPKYPILPKDKTNIVPKTPFDLL